MFRKIVFLILTAFFIFLSGCNCGSVPPPFPEPSDNKIYVRLFEKQFHIPINDAIVTLEKKQEGQYIFVEKKVTNIRGECIFTNLPCGEYRVTSSRAYFTTNSALVTINIQEGVGDIICNMELQLTGLQGKIIFEGAALGDDAETNGGLWIWNIGDGPNFTPLITKEEAPGLFTYDIVQNKIVFANFLGGGFATGDIWIKYLNDGMMPLSSNPLLDERYPRISPDGTRIVYEASPPGTGQIDIFMMNLIDNRTKRITNWQGAEYDPCFSPDGQKILFAATQENANFSSLYTFDLVSNEFTKICDLPFIVKGDTNNCDWHSHLILVNGIDENIYLLNEDGTNLRKVTFGNRGRFADFDGELKIIYDYTDYEETQWGIWYIAVVNLDGKNKTRLLRVLESGYLPKKAE